MKVVGAGPPVEHTVRPYYVLHERDHHGVFEDSTSSPTREDVQGAGWVWSSVVLSFPSRYNVATVFSFL